VAQLHAPVVFPADIEQAVDGPLVDPRTQDPRLVAFTQELRAAEGIARVDPPAVSTDGGVVVWPVIPTTGPADPATEALVHTLRDTVLPAAAQGKQLTAYLGGVTPAVVDLNERVAERLLPFILGVVALSFLLLMVAYRSLVIPAKAALMNLLSIAAAYGVVVAVFQWGWGASALGLDGPLAIQSFVPMMMFAVLFGLSMDYEVFLLTSFNEHWQRTGDMRVAVRRGLADTGQVVTSAAAIMVVIFASFITTDSGVAKMFGVGLATAVLVDATIVRCLLVPALMVLAAKATWWLPRWLDRALPHLHVEGDPAALQSIHRPAPGPPVEPGRPVVGAFAAAAGAAAGAGVGLLVDPRAGAGVVVAATVAGIVAWLPPGVPGAGTRLVPRAVALLGGVVAAAVAVATVNGLVPMVSRSMAGALLAMLLLGTVALLAPPVRRNALPWFGGILAVATAAAVGGYPSPDSPSTAVLLRDAVVTVLAALLLAVLADRVLAALTRPGPAQPEVLDEPVLDEARV
jgi:RND superfamily putative drug exporter